MNVWVHTSLGRLGSVIIFNLYNGLLSKSHSLHAWRPNLAIIEVSEVLLIFGGFEKSESQCTENI